jgi:uncharacterized membrane protein YphA (DoxX/SURF4 family)
MERMEERRLTRLNRQVSTSLRFQMLKRLDKKLAVALLARMLLGGVFIYAGVDKILRPDDFAGAVANYRILPDLLVNLVAVTLPLLELFLGGFLILGIWVPGAALTCNVLLGIFSLALAFNLLRGLDIDCGCFRISLEGAPRASMMMSLLRDCALLGLGIYLLSQQLAEEQRTG